TKLINRIKTKSRNPGLTKILGNALLKLIFDKTISRKAPRGQRLVHQYLPAKNDRIKKKTIIAKTRYPSNGLNNPPIKINGKNQIVINCVFFIRT
ncbi:MAG: hypothetical protein PHY35_05965, partial [Candidatus Omnitrophica bacterium]|nr:hypothetical protein [Candidatus Omnitrophota bacterium]